jgi:limonene-1,2-epoxide hydrolase
MKPKEIIEKWVALFNALDYEGISDLYEVNSINHQTPIGFIKGRENIKLMFKNEFEQYEMVCIIDNIFEDGNVGILEWKDPKGLRGCTLFWFENDKIIYQRGYWDRLTFMEQQNVQ